MIGWKSRKLPVLLCFLMLLECNWRTIDAAFKFLPQFTTALSFNSLLGNSFIEVESRSLTISFSGRDAILEPWILRIYTTRRSYIYMYTYNSRLCVCEWPGSWIESSGFAVNAEDEVSGSLPTGKYGVQPEKHLVAASYLVGFNDACWNDETIYIIFLEEVVRDIILEFSSIVGLDFELGKKLWNHSHKFYG